MSSDRNILLPGPRRVIVRGISDSLMLGPPVFTDTYTVDDEEMGKAVASTKQSARDNAAKAALDSLLKPK